MKRRVGLAIFVLVVLVAICADLLASDLPLYCRVEGQTYWLPCVTSPDALRAMDQQALAARGAILVRTPVPYGPLAQRPNGRLDVLSAPSSAHWLGTDDRGRDVLARLIHGTRVACFVGPLAVALYFLVGVLVGTACAASKRFDLVASRFIEAGMAIPSLLLLLVIQGLSGGGRVVDVALAIALADWAYAARLVRAEALRVAASEHVLAAQSLGARASRVMSRHIIPLALGPALALASFGLGQAILFEGALGLLGYGIAPPTASWGELLAQAMAHPRLWLILPTASAIAMVVLASRLVADDDPR